MTVCLCLFMRGSSNFSQGGGGGGVQAILTKKSSDNVFFFFFFFFLVLSLGYFTEVEWSISFIFQGSRGGKTFSRAGGSNIFQGGGGGSNCLFPIETHITCDFPGGGGSGPPVPPSGSALALVTKSHYLVCNERPCQKDWDALLYLLAYL